MLVYLISGQTADHQVGSNCSTFYGAKICKPVLIVFSTRKKLILLSCL